MTYCVIVLVSTKKVYFDDFDSFERAVLTDQQNRLVPVN